MAERYVNGYPIYKYYDVPLFSWAPENGSNYEPQAEDYAFNYIRNLYNDDKIHVEFNGVGTENDGYVTINSGLRYKWKTFKSDLELDMEYKFIYFGPEDKKDVDSVHHQTMHLNAKILEVVEAAYEL